MSLPGSDNKSKRTQSHDLIKQPMLGFPERFEDPVIPVKFSLMYWAQPF